MRRARAIAAAWVLRASAACAASLALVAAAQTEPPRVAPVALVDLSWAAPVGCPDEASVRGDVQRLLSGSQASAAARADVTHTGDSWRVVVTMNGGERRLEAASCRALADATALIVAMAVDPARVVANRASHGASASAVDAGSGDAAATTATSTSISTPTSTSTATSTPTSTPTPTPTPTATPPTPPARDTAFAASAALASDFGSLPTAAVGASATLAWTPAPFRVELSGAYFFPSSTPNKTVAIGTIDSFSASASFTLLAAALRACWSLRAASFEAGPCVEGEVTSLRGTGHGPGLTQTSGSSGWVAPGGELFGAWRFSRHVGVIARADALIPAIRPDFQVDGATLHTPGTVTGRLSLGVELRF